MPAITRSEDEVRAAEALKNWLRTARYHLADKIVHDLLKDELDGLAVVAAPAVDAVPTAITRRRVGRPAAPAKPVKVVSGRRPGRPRKNAAAPAGDAAPAPAPAVSPAERIV